jgi:hypothetical protein
MGRGERGNGYARPRLRECDEPWIWSRRWAMTVGAGSAVVVVAEASVIVVVGRARSVVCAAGAARGGKKQQQSRRSLEYGARYRWAVR